VLPIDASSGGDNILNLTFRDVHFKAELMFLKAMGCGPDVKPKAMLNLGLVYQTRGNALASEGDLAGAKKAALDSAKYLDSAKPLLKQLQMDGSAESDAYMSRYGPLRLQSHRLMGQIHAGLGDYESCEKEFRAATEAFPNEPGSWQMLGRILEIQGKKEEAQTVIAKLNAIVNGM
jgi:tetratricopeptide (TPR) repeat protein